MTKVSLELEALKIPTSVREAFHAAKSGGCICPLCGQHAKIYRRKITSTMASDLMRLYRKSGLPHGGWGWPEMPFLHLSEFLESSKSFGDFAKLRYWGLIEQAPNNDKAKKTSGMWRITEKGARFVSGLEGVHKEAIIYNGNLLTFAGDSVDIVTALDNKFNYSELMKG